MDKILDILGANFYSLRISDMARIGVYLAGPSGVSEPGRLWHSLRLLPAVLEAGLLPVYQ